MTKPQTPRKFTRALWTADEVAYLQQHYADSTSQAIADHLGRSLRKTYAKAYGLKLNKSAAFLASEASGRMQQPLHGGKAHWFKKGSVPQNKGKKAKYNANSAATQFGPGHLPANYREVGALRINGEGYIDIKMAEGKHQWFLLSHYNWFLHNGWWPHDGHCIWYKNGDKHDCAVENLEILTRQEHLQRTTLHRLPKSVVDVILLRGQLTKAINRRQKQTLQPQHFQPGQFA